MPGSLAGSVQAAQSVQACPPSARQLPSPVCARHAVRTAELVRRRLRLTPEVNSGYAPAVGRTPDVARGPSALRELFPGCNCAPDLDVPSKKLEIFSFDTTIRLLSDRSRPPQVGADMQAPGSCRLPFAQDTLYELLHLYDGGCA